MVLLNLEKLRPKSKNLVRKCLFESQNVDDDVDLDVKYVDEKRDLMRDILMQMLNLEMHFGKISKHFSRIPDQF